MITCTRRIQFCAGHRVHGHESKCRNAHGHNYVVLFQAAAPELDTLGRVIDFSVLKARLGGWIDRWWDHGFLYWEQDREMDHVMGQIGGQKVFVMPTNPTAENMAEYLLRIICPQELLHTGIIVQKVTVWETENCHAEALLDQ